MVVEEQKEKDNLTNSYLIAIVIIAGLKCLSPFLDNYARQSKVKIFPILLCSRNIATTLQ